MFFPQHWCKSQGIAPGVFNSIINKTPLSKLSNIAVGGDAPSIYLARIEKNQGLSSAELDDILRTHLIEPEHLRTDNFDAFYEARTRTLATLVSEAMGKPVVEEHGSNEVETETEIDDLVDVTIEEEAYQETV